MKKISIRSLFSIFGLACLSLVFAFISCEIGLGSAVDTQAPVVNFAETTIGSGGVIRDSFMIYGDWTDDGSIKEVTAKLTRTDGTKISFENAGTVVTLEAGKGTWNAVFDPIKEKIPDGSYEISVSMLDNGKHISTITRAIVIDNTAPLVVLSRPSTKKDSGKFDSYGQSFTLEGKAADDNDVSLIEVNVYADESCTGTPLKTIQLPNVPLTIEQDVAVYDKTKANDYSIIYGHVDAEGIAIKDGTTSQRYCTLVVYDGAQRYPSDGSEQTEADKKGNSVNYYYLNSDVSKLFTAGYKITELYHILNGSYEQGTASRSISSSDVNTLLADPSKQTTCGQFSLNPENSPSYVVSSRNVLPEGHKFDEYPITNGNSQLEVEIAPGLDGHLIVEDTVGIYLVRCDLTGNPLTTNGTPAASEAEAKKVWLVETDKHEEQAIVTQSGSTYKFKTKKNIGNDDTSGYPQLVIGENYYIAVVGKDEQGNDIVCDGLYGFQLITSGKNIEVGIKAEPEWLSTEADANEANKKVKITLTYQTENKPFDIYRKFGQDITSTDTPIITGINDSPYEDNISAADLSSEPGFVNYKVKGKESAESNQKTIELKYDNDVPATPTFTSVPSVTATEQDDITFQGTAEDTASGSGIEKVWVQFEYKDSTGATKTTTAKEVDASYSGKKWIYQTSQKTDAKVKAAFATQGSKKIIVTAEDVVGLTKSSSQTFTYDTGKPTVSVTEGLPSIVGQVQTLSGTAGDTWGVKKIVITQTKKGSTDSISYKYWEEGENASTPTTSKAWSVSIPLKSTTESYTAIDSTSSGEYTYTVTVTDKAEKTTTSDSVTVKFTSAKPTITFTQPSGALALTNSASTTPWQTTSNNITISGTASVSAAVSGATISKVEYKFDNDAAWTSAGQASWSITKTINDGSTAHNLYVKATDNAGNVSEEYHRFIKVDTSAPNLTAKYLKQDTGVLKDASGTVYVKSGTKLYLYGNYDDEHSGVKTLTFTLGGNTINPANLKYSTTAITSTTPPTNYSDYSAGSSTAYKSWQAEFTFTSNGTLTVQGKNNANKETTTLSVVNVVYDNDAPVVKISSPAKNEKLKAADLTISGTANDGTGSGLSSGTGDIIIYYTKSSTLGGVTTAPTSITSSENHSDAESKWVKLGTTASDTNWSFTLSSINNTITPADVNTPLYFTASAKDIAGTGNVGYAVPVAVIVDRKKPVYDSSALTIGGKTHTQMTASDKPWFSTDTLVVKGKYTDDGTTGSGVNTIIYKLDSNSEVELPTTDGTFNTNISGFTANSTLKIKAKDKAGNETDWTTYTVQADTSTTTLTIDTYKAGNDAEKTATGTVYLKSGTQITLTGQYKNTVSGVKPLEVKLGDTDLPVKYSTNGSSYGNYSDSSAKAYTKWQATFTPAAGGTITVNGSNYAEVPVTASSFQLTVDGEDPTLENLKLKETTGSGDNTVTKESYFNESTEIYYINNSTTAAKSFKLTGVTTDDYGVEKVSFTVVNTADTNEELTISDISKPSGAWEKDITGWSSWNDGATVTITATDKAGRSTPKTINIVFDTTAPKAMHWADKKNKDVYFRIGNADNDKNDDGTKWETEDALSDTRNQDVGSKYSFGSWGNDSSIEIRGYFYEEATAGSGIKAIHYAIFDDESKVAAGTTALVAGTLKENKENHVIKVGSFSIQNEVTKRVPYTKENGTKAGITVKTNFRETISGFDASNNFLVLVAEDNAGNREPDTLAVYEGTGTPGSNSWNSLKAYYSIKKDSQTPNITTTTPNLYTNGAGESLSVTGTASDTLSGLGSVTVTVEEIHFEQVIKNFADGSASDGSASQNWTATISADKFAGINSGSYTVYAEAKDKAGAGNKKKISAGTIYVDKDAPVVTISSPVADSVTKKTFTISGTARDGNGAGIDETKDLVLYYTKKENPAAITSSTKFGSSSEADTKWVAYSTKPTLDSTNHQDWDCEVDFSSIAADNNNTDVYLSVSATDKSGSGNTGYSAPRKVTVDRKKPVKSSFNIGSTAEADIAKAWFNNTTLNINGAFADNGGSGVTEILYTLDSGSEISIPAGENGTFDSNIAGFTNGVHTLKVRAKDAADNESAYSSATTYTIHVDNQASTLNCTTSGQQYTNGVNNITVSGTFVDSPATDCAGADTITLSVNNKTINATLTPQNDYSSGTWTATITTSSLGLVQGTTYSVNGTITDKAGNSSTATVFTLNIDTTAPTVSITTPEVNSKINGTISLSGTVNYEGSIPSKLELYALTSKPTNKNFMNGSGNNPPSALIATKTDATQIYSWTFDNIDVKTKAGVTVSAPEKPIYFVLAVYDTAGNCNVYNTSGTATLTEGTNFFKYTVDQNLDRPVIKFTNLDDASSWVKSSVLKGSITDDDGIKTFKIKEGSNSAETVVVTNGSWEYTFKSLDGENISLEFTVQDNDNTSFTTANSDMFHRPYFLYADNSDNNYQSAHSYTDYGYDNSAALSLKKDTQEPRLLDAGTSMNADKTKLATVASVKADTTNQYEIKASNFSGGNKKYLKFYVPVNDANLEEVTLAIADSSTGVVEKLYTTVKLTENQTDKNDFNDDGILKLKPTNTKKTSDSVEYTYYESDIIDVSGVTDSGLKSVSFDVKDKAGNVTSKSYTFYVDNTGPEVPTITSPSKDDEITGTTTITGTASDSGIGIESIEWLVPPAGTTASTSDATLLALSGWKNSNNNGTASVFKFKFQTNTDCDLVNFDNTTNYAVTHNAANGLYTIPVYFKITDKLGNYTIYKDYHITHNPDGDRPKTEINYPTDADYDVNAQGASLGYITLGGTIRVSGTVEIPSGTVEVGKVYIQIGTIDANGTPSWDKDNSTLANEFTVLGGTKDKTALGTEYGADKLIYVANDWWGIPAITKTATWNISLNTTNKLDPGSSGTTNIAIRACAINADGKMGNWSEVSYIHVDKNAPSQNAIIRQYNSSFTPADATNAAGNTALESNVTVNKDYASEMFLKGKWYLVVTLNDNDSLAESSIKVKQGSADCTYYKSTTTGTGAKTKKLYIPVDTTNMTTSSVSYSVYVEDSSGYSSTGTYNFKIDNTAPVLSEIAGNGDDLDTNAENTVKERDYVYTISGKLDDSGSGYERVLFYFVRNGKIYGTTTDYGTAAVLDPLVTSNAKVPISELSALSVGGTGIPKLYAKQATGSAITAGANAGTYTFTDTSSAVSGNNHIHKGALIYIDGEYGKITAVSGATVTFKMDANPVGKTTVYFPYAASVDNLSTEEVSSTTANPFTFSNSSDDGDLMPESITNVSTTWTWKGTIHSSNIPDGPASLVVLAFDAAGNVSGNTYPVDVKNNTPRLAKLFLGTDLNSSGSISADEFSEYSSSITGTNDTAVTIATAGSTAGQFTAKDKLAVKPEIIGGNGTIKMIYKRGATTATPVAKSDSLALVAYDSGSKTSGTNTNGWFYTYTLSSDAVWQGLTADPANSVGVSFTFWDETEERTQGTNSQNCVAYISDLIIDLEDAEAPLAKIYPFYWKDKTDNSLYENKASNGHIDLEGDNGTTVPWVSGKIKITGTAYDNKMLHTIALKANGFKFNGGTAGNALTFATYNGSAWTLTKGSGTSQTAGGSITEDGWKFELDQNSEVLDQTGHTINWTLYLDTEKVAGGALNNVAVEAILTDWASKTKATADKTSAPSTTQTVKDSETPYYKMNVVPYVVGIKTNLSSLKKTNSSVFDRTALGHYTTNASSPIYLYGFNLAGGTLYDSSTTAKTAALTAKTVAATADYPWYTTASSGATENFFKNTANTTVYQASVSTFKSGPVYVKVGNVNSTNNTNNNDSKGDYEQSVNLTNNPSGDSTIYSNYYNRQPNGDSNNLLTDDLVLDVWLINSSAAPTISGRVDQPIMKINPATGQLNFAYANGPLYFTMGSRLYGGDSTSYDYWMGSYDFFTSIGYTVDKLGYGYGVAAGGDINANSTDNFIFATGRWGVGGRGQRGSYDGAASLRLEQIAQVVNGTNIFNKNRILSPSLATAVHGTTTDLYLVYYDDINQQIRVRKGALDSVQNQNSTGKKDFGTFIDRYTEHQNNGNAPVQNYDYNKNDYTIIAGGNTGYTSGEYVSLAVKSAEGNTTDDVLVVIWYDSTNKVLYYTYHEDPLNMTTGASGYTGTKKFVTPTPVFTETGIGEYCKIAVDKNGGIHVAAYDSSNADVKYAYRSGYNTGSWSEYTVDSNGILGSELTLDVAYNSANGNAVPYIGYYASSAVRPKVAYLAKPAALASGCDSDLFTGVWEVSYVPTDSSVPEDHINVGVWKNNGVITNSNTSTKQFRNATEATPTSNTVINAGQNGTLNGYSSTQWGYVFGNGTANPVLGYQVKKGTSGNIETAQMR